MKNISKIGFTLSEVLITLGIIGVVAAFTIPTIIQNAQEQATVSQLKKIYSTLSQAYTLAVQANGTPENWGLADYATASSGAADNIMNTLVPYLSISKNCGTSGVGCFGISAYKYLSGAPAIDFADTRYAKSILADGTILIVYSAKANCDAVVGTTQALSSMGGYIVIDINGFKKPNQMGVDLFYFYLTKYGIIPIGSQQETGYPFSSSCRDKSSQFGFGCTAWVIYNENLDYSKCNTLSWGGPIKCN